MESSMERRVRNALTDQKAKELYQQIQTPEYQKAAKEIMINSAKEIEGSVKSGLSEEDIVEYVNDFISDKSLDLSSLCRTQAEIEYMSQDRFDTFSYSFLLDLDKLGAKEETKNRIKARIGQLKGLVAIRDKVIEELAKVAEEKGIDYAISKEVRNEATRKFFPTAEDYSNFMFNILNLRDNFIEEYQKSIDTDSKLKKVAGEDFIITKSLAKGFSNLEEILIKEEIKEIYE